MRQGDVSTVEEPLDAGALTAHAPDSSPPARACLSARRATLAH